MFSFLAQRKTILSLSDEPVPNFDPEQPGCDCRPILQAGSLPEVQGARKRIAMLASVCAQGSALAAIFRHPTICAILLVFGFSVIAWGYRAESQTPDRTKSRSKLWMFLMVWATLVGCAIGVFLLVPNLHYRVVAQAGGPRSGSTHTKQGTGDSLDSSYIAVILWPKHPQKVRIIAPPPRAKSATLARPSKPLEIPFDGAYWYLQAPAKVPGRKARIAHGSSTRIDIHSADWHPIIMEAHQRLALPIDPRCCRELDLSILNADDRPGAIRIAVKLIDSSSSRGRSEDLGIRPVFSSMPPEFSMNRPPTNEVLSYPIPANPAIHQFDEIEVIFLPSKERSRGGTQVAIRRFRLLPF
ncbi:hypothetical protein [Acidipila rosea]|uniref:Uncharacterized protein n=1 Tax=Acidipila rosea TaxID=768535 RepID=A0A4R1LC61_9BACT|nr:hypothetical protein [Acidipila rosea]MBW4043807.1 hypothetical protein [Acidobacteriota bacterium]TCK74109.1 hypothetical protein C7378_1729 [Acidipila rosea]